MDDITREGLKRGNIIGGIFFGLRKATNDEQNDAHRRKYVRP